MDIRLDFPMLKDGIIYFDNAATTFKPNMVIDSVKEYYSDYCANVHRGDYNISLKTDMMFENSRKKVANFINSSSVEEIVFTSGTTEGLNIITNGFLKNYLKEGDEVLTTKSEHASLLLPLFKVCKETDSYVKYIKLNDEYKITLDNLKESINKKTKVIFISHITNVIGDIRPIKEIVEIAHKNNILVIVDGAQSIGHMKIDVNELDVDFFVFSGHKMTAPTGIGVLYGKYDLLNSVTPLILGGGMNTSFLPTGEIEYKTLPHRLEAGTNNIAGVIGLGSAIDYLNMLDINMIFEYEKKLKEYLVKKLKELDDIIIYNETSESSIVTFNVKDVFSQDTAIYLNDYNICIRSGNHCAKILKDEINTKNTCRISLSFYNTQEEIDKLISVLKSSKGIINQIL